MRLFQLYHKHENALNNNIVLDKWDLLRKELEDDAHDDEHESQAAHDAEESRVVVAAGTPAGVGGVLWRKGEREIEPLLVPTFFLLHTTHPCTRIPCRTFEPDTWACSGRHWDRGGIWCSGRCARTAGPGCKTHRTGILKKSTDTFLLLMRSLVCPRVKLSFKGHVLRGFHSSIRSANCMMQKKRKQVPSWHFTVLEPQKPTDRRIPRSS